jgi:hypothetical protein
MSFQISWIKECWDFLFWIFYFLLCQTNTLDHNIFDRNLDLVKRDLTKNFWLP